MMQSHPLITWFAPIASGAIALFGNAAAATSDFRLDTVHTQIIFSVSHVGFSKSSGLLHVRDGRFAFDPDDWSKSTLDVTIDMTSVDMGNAAWNDKVRSREFFASGHYATAHFVSSSVVKSGENTGVVHGKLTLLGVTHPLDLNLTFNRIGLDPYSFKWTAGFSAAAAITRSRWGMSKYLPDVGDKVDLRIEVEGVRDKQAETAKP